MWPARAYGGTLTLVEGRLTWKRSAWARWPFGHGGDKRPAYLEIDLKGAAAAPAGRMPPAPLFLFFGLLIPFLSGWFRKCIAVQPERADEAYCFAVKDVEGWLADIARAMLER